MSNDICEYFVLILEYHAPLPLMERMGCDLGFGGISANGLWWSVVEKRIFLSTNRRMIRRD